MSHHKKREKNPVLSAWLPVFWGNVPSVLYQLLLSEVGDAGNNTPAIIMSVFFFHEESRLNPKTQRGESWGWSLAGKNGEPCSAWISLMKSLMRNFRPGLCVG